MNKYDELKNNLEFSEYINKLSKLYNAFDLYELTDELYNEYSYSVDNEDELNNNGFINYLKETIIMEEAINSQLKKINENHYEAQIIEILVTPVGLSKKYKRRILIPSFYSVSRMCYAIFASFNMYSEELYECIIDDIKYETILNEDIDEESFIAEEEILDLYPLDLDTKISIKFNDYKFNVNVLSINKNDSGYDDAYILEGIGYRLIIDKYKEIKNNLENKKIDDYELNEAINLPFNLEEANEMLPKMMEQFIYSYEEEPFEEEDNK